VQEQMRRTDIDQIKEARVIGVDPPFLVASASLDPSGGENAINVLVSGLDHEDLPVTGFDKMAAFLQVRQGGDPEPIRPDQFALSVIDVSHAVGTNFVLFRIKRLDTSGGWGQRLKIQILFFGS
jgi:hypothetical protein